QEVADEEYARAEAVCRIAESQRLLHLKQCISDVDAIQKRDHVTNNQEGENPPTDLGEQPCDRDWLLFRGRNCTDAGCVHSHCLLPSFVLPRSLLLRVGLYLLFLPLDAWRAAVTTAADVPHNRNLKYWTRVVRNRGRLRRAHGSRSFERPRARG